MFLLPIAQAAESLPVETTLIDPADHYYVERRFVGQLEARRSTQLAFENAGKVDAVLVEEGDNVAAGQPLARLDVLLLNIQLKEAEAEKKALAAQLNLAEISLSRSDKLRAAGNITMQAYDEAKSQRDIAAARVAAMAAKINLLKTQLEKAVLKAPYASMVKRRFVDEGTIVAPSVPIVELIEADKWQFRVGIPQRFLSALSNNVPEYLQFNEQRLPIKLLSINPSVDPNTRTVEILFALNLDGVEVEKALYSGALASLGLQQRFDIPGFWVPTTAMTEGIRGLWSVYVLQPTKQQALDESINYQIKPINVVVLHQAAEYTYIAGLENKTYRIVQSGLHKYVPNQIVSLSHEKYL